MRSRSFERVTLGIEDMDVRALPGIQAAGAFLAVGKHLCGAATDFALRSAEFCASGPAPHCTGLAIATCCHFRCSWVHFFGQREFLAEGFTPEEFELVSYMSGWALCGHGRPGGKDEEDEDEDNPSATDPAPSATDPAAASHQSEPSSYPPLDTFGIFDPCRVLLRELRQAVGARCKELIDSCRLLHLKAAGFLAEGVRYIPADVSGENLLLLASVGSGSATCT